MPCDFAFADTGDLAPADKKQIALYRIADEPPFITEMPGRHGSAFEHRVVAEGVYGRMHDVDDLLAAVPRFLTKIAEHHRLDDAFQRS